MASIVENRAGTMEVMSGVRQGGGHVGAATSRPRSLLSSYSRSFIAVAMFSCVINILMLSGSLFMLQVYDRVLPSRSIPTLIGLVVLIVLLYVFHGVLDIVRGRMLVRIGRSLDDDLSRDGFEAVVRLPFIAKPTADGLQPLHDVDRIRSFLSGAGPTALFDLPWMPLYLALCFAFHFWIGLTALAGAILLILLTVVTELKTREPTRTVTNLETARMTAVDAARRNAEVIRAMGMTERFAGRWGTTNSEYLTIQGRVSDITGGLGAISRILRMILQSAVLAVGAYLVIHQEATAGVIVASSVITSRALAPVELAIAHWKGFLMARRSWSRLSAVLDRLTTFQRAMNLPAPSGMLTVEAISVAPPGHTKVVVGDISFRLQAGQGLGIIGPSASGKSSLARAIVGVWQPLRGKVRLDNAALDQWSPDDLGRHIGYLPQDVELFDGTVAENIARFESTADSGAVIAAARAAQVHDLILGLPEGYETRIGEGGAALSAGQCQRIALARALYGDPFLVVLDEPNSNLDSEGDQALNKAIRGIRDRGGIIIAVTHRRAALACTDLVLAMANGKAQAFGPTEEVLHNLLRPSPPAPLKVVAESQAQL